MRVLSEEEIKAGNDRRSYLYQSAYTIDNITAVLMDTSMGGFGLYEETARAKAHAIIGWLKTINGIDVPTRTKTETMGASDPATR